MNPQLWFNPEASAALSLTLLHSVWQVSFVLLLLRAAFVAWRRLSIERLYALHVLGLLVCLAALPVTFTLLYSPADSVPVELEPVAYAAADNSHAPTAMASSSVLTSETRDASNPVLRPMSASSVELSRSQASTTRIDWWFIVAAWVSAVYVLGVVMMLLRLVRSIHRTECLRRQSQPITRGPLAQTLDRLSREFRMRVRCTLATSCEVIVPTVVGFVKPTILLPASAVTGLSAGELEMILVHELAHVRRYDLWVNLLQRAAEVVLFFNPALWYLSRKIATLREYCCDELTCRQMATEAEQPRVEYASTLLRVLELAHQTSQPADLAALAATGRTPSELRRRVARLFGEPLTEPVRLSRGAMWLVGVALVVCCGVFAQSHSGSEDQEGDRTKIEESADAGPEKPTLEELLAKFANYERAHLPYHLKTLKTIGMHDEATDVMRDSLPWGDGRLHQDIMEHVQGDSGRWLRKEISLVDQELTTQAAWYCDGDVVTCVSRDDADDSAAPRVTEDTSGAMNYSWAEPLFGVLPLSMYSNGQLLTEAIEQGKADVKLDWNGDDARLEFSYGDPGLRSNFVVWLSAEHDWFPIRVQRYDADSNQLRSEWNATQLVRHKDSWRILASRFDYRGHPESPSDEPSYYVDIEMLEANYSDDAVQELLDPSAPEHGVFLYAAADSDEIKRELAEAEIRAQKRDSQEAIPSATTEPFSPKADSERIKFLKDMVDSYRQELATIDVHFQTGQRPKHDVVLAQYQLSVALAKLAEARGNQDEVVKYYTEAVDSAKQNVAIHQSAYKAGVISMDAVLIAERNLAEAELNLKTAQKVLDGSGTITTPPKGDPDRIEYLKEMVESYRKQLARAEVQVREGVKPHRELVLVQYALAAAMADLADAQGAAKVAVKHFTEAVDAAQANVTMLELAFREGDQAVTEEELLQAQRQLAKAKERLRLAKRALEDADNSTSSAAETVPIFCIAEGKPVDGAEVYVFQHSGGDDGVYRQFGPLTTDSDGRTECDEALFTTDAGNYDRFLYARLPGKLVGVSRSVNWKSRDPMNAEGRIEMRPSQSLTGKVTVPEGFDPTEVQVKVRVLTVRTGPGELEFTMFPRYHPFATLDTALPELFEAKPDSDGTFQLHDIPVERGATLVAEANGLAEAQWHKKDGEDSETVELKCAPEGVLSGRVTTPDGSPVVGVEVAASIKTSGTRRTVTDQHGQYELRGLPEWDLVVSVKDPQERWIARPSEPFFLSPGSSETLDVQLEQGANVSGQVTDPEGEPIKGVTIAALLENGTYTEVARDSSDADGQYTLRLPNGTVGLHFGSLPSEFEQQEARILTVRKNQQVIDDVDFTLQRKATDTNPSASTFQERRDMLKSLLDSMALVNGYGLAEGQVLGRVAPPFAPIRGEWHRMERNAEPDSSLPTSMTFRWDGENLTRWSTSYGNTDNPGYSLKELMNALLRIKPQQMDGPRNLLSKPLPGDWVVRQGADRDEVVSQLETILRVEFGMNVKLEFREVERDVYIASGRYHFSPLSDEQGEGRRGASDPILVFGTKTLPEDFVGNGLGDFDGFLNGVGDWIGMPIVNELAVPTDRQFSWRKYQQSPHNDETRRQDHDPETVLRNISRQTGLEFTKGKRKVELLFVAEL